jgi:hypothetical protein
VDVKSITIHPEYDADVIDHDISVWKLASPIEEGQDISFVTLPEAGFDPVANTTVHVAGWCVTHIVHHQSLLEHARVDVLANQRTMQGRLVALRPRPRRAPEGLDPCRGSR